MQVYHPRGRECCGTMSAVRGRKSQREYCLEFREHVFAMPRKYVLGCVFGLSFFQFVSRPEHHCDSVQMQRRILGTRQRSMHSVHWGDIQGRIGHGTVSKLSLEYVQQHWGARDLDQMHILSSGCCNPVHGVPCEHVLARQHGLATTVHLLGRICRDFWAGVHALRDWDLQRKQPGNQCSMYPVPRLQN